MITHNPAAIDTPEGRLHALAGSLYYVVQLNRGYANEYVFDALASVDQQFFEHIAQLALEAAAHWRSDVAPVVAPAVRPGLTLVSRLDHQGA